MPYTPPAWNAVDFNFTVTYFDRPPGLSIIFNFGAAPSPPFVDAQLPRGRRPLRIEEDEWFPDFFKRKFAPVGDAFVPSAARHALSNQILEPEEAWTRPRRRIGYVPIAVTTLRRPVLFTIT